MGTPALVSAGVLRSPALGRTSTLEGILLSGGVSPALVAVRLGQDVKTLLTTYAHVIRNNDERVRAIVDESLGVSAEGWLRTEAVS